MPPEPLAPIVVFSTREDVRSIQSEPGRGAARARGTGRVLVADLSGPEAARNEEGVRRALRPGDAVVALVPPGGGTGALHADACALDLAELRVQALEASRGITLEGEIQDRQGLQESLIPVLRDADLRSHVGRFVAEHTRLHEALREELAVRHEELLAVIDSIPDPVVVLDGAGRILRTNKIFRSEVGASSGGTTGGRIEELLRPAPDGARGPWAAFKEEGRLRDFEAGLRSAGAGFLPVSINASPLAAGEGSERGSVWVLRDLRAWKLLQAETLQAEKMAAVGRLAAGVAHDFNNLLTVIIADAQLGSGESRAGPLGDAFREILAAARQAADLTRQLLAFGRREEVKPRAICLKEALESVSWALKRLMPEDVSVDVEARRGPWGVFADPGQIRQVVLNLALNARDAMPGGGRIRIELDGAPPAGAVPMVRLTVSDSGEGMAPEVARRVFEPFFTTKEGGRGSGLGLAVVYGVVKRHDGEIRVESAPGRGSRFEVEFPRAQALGPAASEAPSAAAAPARRARVLIVEDEDSVRRLIHRVVERSGHWVVSTSRPEEALRRLDAGERFDLLVTDVVMPGMSGADLRVQCLRRAPGMRVLFVSGYPDEALGRHGLTTADVPFLAKPFGPFELNRKVNEALRPGDPPLSGPA